MQKILEIYFKIYAYLENNKFLNSIKRSLILLVPVFMIGKYLIAKDIAPIINTGTKRMRDLFIEFKNLLFYI